MNNNFDDSIFDLVEDEIVSIELLGDQETIDITVEDTHMFFANDIYTHNSGYNAELISLESIAEAYSKCFPADFIMTLSRTTDEKAQGLGKFFLVKNRNGQDGLIFKVRVDTATSVFEVLSEHIQQDQKHDNSKPTMMDRFKNTRSHK